VAWYGEDEIDSLNTALRRQSESTEVDTLEIPTQLMLTPDGTTVAGAHRITWPALRQICRFLCPGLVSVIGDMSGFIPRRRVVEYGYYSPEAAIGVYNQVLTSRFETAIQGNRVILSTDPGRIDAVVGKSYQRLPNDDFLSQVCSDVPGRVISAAFASRRLFLWYQTTTPVSLQIDGQLLAVRGGLFARSYEGGDGALLLCPAIGIGESPAWAVRPVCRKTRVRHVGASFPANFAAAVDACRVVTNFQTLVEERLNVLSRTSLGFSLHQDLSEDTLRASKLTESVRAAKVPPAFARRVVRRALYSGGETHPDPPQLISATRDQWARRTRLSLFLAVIREAADSSHPRIRENAETWAYRMLFDADDSVEVFNVQA
jgi:hypothetical protein